MPASKDWRGLSVRNVLITQANSTGGRRAQTKDDLGQFTLAIALDAGDRHRSLPLRTSKER